MSSHTLLLSPCVSSVFVCVCVCVLLWVLKESVSVLVCACVFTGLFRMRAPRFHVGVHTSKSVGVSGEWVCGGFWRILCHWQTKQRNKITMGAAANGFNFTRLVVALNWNDLASHHKSTIVQINGKTIWVTRKPKLDAGSEDSLMLQRDTSVCVCVCGGVSNWLQVSESKRA